MLNRQPERSHHTPQGALGCQTQGTAARHPTTMAVGLRLGGYTTQPEDSSACSLNQENPFE